MRSAVAIAIDGVLRHEIGHVPIPEGLELYRVMEPHYNVVLLADEDNPAYRDEVMHFLHTEQLTGHSKVSYGNTSSIDAPGRRARQVQHLRNTGHPLAFVIEADPHKSARLMEIGVNVMHFMHAQYARPQWRPGFDREQTPWDALVEQEIALKTTKADDKRIHLG